MKTIRTILGTLAVVILGYGLLAVISFRSNSAFLQRTLYQIFSQSYFVALVLGVAFLLIAIILTVALMSFRDDEREEEPEEDDGEDDFPSDDDVQGNERASMGSFRRATRPQLFDPEDDDDQIDDGEEDSTPAFLKGESNSRIRPKERTAPEMPSVATIFGEQEEEPIKPEKKHEAKHCVFCNAVIEDGSKTCPSCGKRL